MDKFTRINLNGEVKYVSAIFDGSGREIESTYETIENVTNKETALSTRIDKVNNDLTALSGRVETVEGYSTTLEQQAERIQTNTSSIEELKTSDTTFKESLDNLTIKVGENTVTVTSLSNTVNSLNESYPELSGKVGTLEAIVNDEASGINALNTQADTNTSDIALANQEITGIKTSMSNMITQEVFNALVARVESLEAALAANHPE